MTTAFQIGGFQFDAFQEEGQGSGGANRPALRKLRAKLTRVVATFLKDRAKDIAHQVLALRARFGKVELTPDEQDTLEKILGELDFSGWAALAGDVDELLQAIADDSA